MFSAILEQLYIPFLSAANLQWIYCVMEYMNHNAYKLWIYVSATPINNLHTYLTSRAAQLVSSLKSAQKSAYASINWMQAQYK